MDNNNENNVYFGNTNGQPVQPVENPYAAPQESVYYGNSFAEQPQDPTLGQSVQNNYVYGDSQNLQQPQQPVQPQVNAYGQPQANPYVQPQANAYGQPQMNTYGQPQQPQQNFGYTPNYAYVNPQNSYESANNAQPISKSKAITSMAMGIAGLVCAMTFWASLIGLPLSIVALVLSGSFVKENHNTHVGFSKAGKITGIVGTILNGIMFFIVFIVIIVLIIDEM